MFKGKGKVFVSNQATTDRFCGKMKKKGEAVLTPDEQESRKSLDDF